MNVDTDVQLKVEEVERVAALGDLLERIEGMEGGFVLGDFGLRGIGRYSYLGIKPREVISFRYGQEEDPFALLEKNIPNLRVGMASIKKLPPNVKLGANRRKHAHASVGMAPGGAPGPRGGGGARPGAGGRGGGGVSQL